MIEERINNDENPDVAWRGYTMEDLKYRRSLSYVRLRMQREKLVSEIQGMKSGKDVGASQSFLSGIFNGYNTLDYAILGFKSYWRIRKILKYFSNRKNH